MFVLRNPDEGTIAKAVEVIAAETAKNPNYPFTTMVNAERFGFVNGLGIGVVCGVVMRAAEYGIRNHKEEIRDGMKSTREKIKSKFSKKEEA